MSHSHSDEEYCHDEWREIAKCDGLRNEVIEELLAYIKQGGILKKGWYNPPHLLVIQHQRYWLSDRQLESVKKIKTQFPKEKHPYAPDYWETVVLNEMSNGRL